MHALPSFRRILLKLSGETLLGKYPFGIDFHACTPLVQTLRQWNSLGMEIGIVIGGGNIFRGIHLAETGISRVTADQMGMLSTVINGLALEQALTIGGCPAKLLSAVACSQIAEQYTHAHALKVLESGSIAILVGGTGNPYFTTDTAAALRASELHMDVLIKATKVDGVYDRDPKKHLDAFRYDRLSYAQVVADKLGIMDATAITLCWNQHIPIFVCNMNLLYEENGLERIKKFEGTIIHT